MKKFYFVYCILLSLSACKKWDKPEQIPAYIHIDEIELSVTSTQGTASHGIIDAWVYVNDQPLGAYDLPCTVPVLATGNQKITVFPGIKDNGITEARVKYPMLEEYITYNVQLKAGEVANMSGTNKPVVTYLPSSKIDIWNENFDNAAIDFNADPNSEAGVTFIADSTIAFEGDGMGLIELPSGYTYARVITAQTFNLPRNGKPVYVELNYNTNNSMAVGLEVVNGTSLTDIDQTVLNATDGVWKKIYINLTQLVSEQTVSTFKFLLTITKDDGVTTVQNYIDNFKVVYVK